MKKLFVFFIGAVFSAGSSAQSLQQKLHGAIQSLEKDAQMKHASFSLYVVNSKTGEKVFAHNEQMGLAPASTLKIVTAATAYELLGKTFQYKTQLGYDGNIENETITGKLILKGYGDPTLGSWRWKQTTEAVIAEKISNALKTNNIKSISGDLLIDESNWETQATPNGWTWEDIGNYYGAGASAVNWHENKYDIFFKPGKNIGDAVEILSIEPALPAIPILNELKTAKPGSGDNSIIYLPENGQMMAIRGTLPAGVDKFKVSGSFSNSAMQMAMAIKKMLANRKIILKGKLITAQDLFLNNKKPGNTFNHLMSIESPPLDSMAEWFLKESINLYGEAFVKTWAFQKNGFGTSEDGIDILQNFWATKGIEKSALNIKDGSGLSPANRVTSHALVSVLQYAKKQTWYSSFENALPLQNGLKMKSGYITGVRSYTGYIKSKLGDEYSFAFIINNFDGSSANIRNRMWKILDLMK
ncbi:MAG TPA: D-alanyl-D-alanine carboxypeptidase/D-alanyl-D-alanine-endopeptidase [Ferruginibacter sp.]|nr:D-alanyl-D-alanine carboxypeptidase/D-alanyl-D-alanine-endopeptidase [Ferruginibacter sp.]